MIKTDLGIHTILLVEIDCGNKRHVDMQSFWYIFILKKYHDEGILEIWLFLKPNSEI